MINIRTVNAELREDANKFLTAIANQAQPEDLSASVLPGCRVVPDVLHMTFSSPEAKGTFLKVLEKEISHIKGDRLRGTPFVVAPQCVPLGNEDGEALDYSDSPTLAGIDLNALGAALPLIDICRKFSAVFGEEALDQIEVARLDYISPPAGLNKSELVEYEKMYGNRVEIVSSGQRGAAAVEVLQQQLEGIAGCIVNFEPGSQIWTPTEELTKVLVELSG